MKFSKVAALGITIAFVTSVAFAKAIPEFDGAYIKTKTGQFKELKAESRSYTQISRAGMGIMSLINQPKIYYMANKKGMISVSPNEFKGVAVRGNYKFKTFHYTL